MSRPMTLKDRAPQPGDILTWGYQCYCGDFHRFTRHVCSLSKAGTPQMRRHDWSGPKVSMERFLNAGKRWEYVKRVDGGPVTVGEEEGE